MKGIIFDLDDTLYSEKKYVKSGFEKVGKFLDDEEAVKQLWKFFQDGRPAIDSYLNLVGRNDLKDKCLEIYRNQKPQIHLYPGVNELIKNFISRGIKVGIITDGRVEGQKRRSSCISNDISFSFMLCICRFHYDHIAYVGDNVVKDFQAAKQLGMIGVFFRNKDGLYVSEKNDTEIQTINDLHQLLELKL